MHIKATTDRSPRSHLGGMPRDLVTIPNLVLDRWRAEARTVLTDFTSTENLRRLAWRFLKNWGAAPCS